MNIDQRAPLVARQGIFIAAPVAKVWALQTNIAQWPQWQPDISSVRLEGPVASGTIFRWTAKGLKITSTIQEVVLERRIGWTGRALGMYAVHTWTFERRDTGTQVITEESLAGWVPRLLKLVDPTFLEKSLAASLQVLKQHAEQ